MKYLAPAKVNLNLLLEGRDDRGYHPLHSLAQTIEWCDELTFTREDEDSLSVSGADLAEDENNLVMKALTRIRQSLGVPPLAVTLDKRVPIAAGLGGGSSDAAATLVAGCDLTGAPHSLAIEVSPDVGADVPLFIDGGTKDIEGYGEIVSEVPPLVGFALAVVVPDFELSTGEVYSRWDALGEPVGFEVPDRFLPPGLRHAQPIRNDLFRAAVDVEPALGDFVSDVSIAWDGAVLLTGSGSSCFGFFSDVDEAEEAATSIPNTRAARGVALRPRGVERVDHD